MKTRVFLLAVILASCASDETPGPSLDSVVPGLVTNAAESVLTIRGRFPAPPHADFDEPDSGDGGFHATLVGSASEIALGRPSRVDARTLEATLAGGAPIGTWTLRVVDSRGRHAELGDALRIVAPCEVDADCDDGDGCTTHERCVAHRCEAGSRDRDADGDGFVASTCGGYDCDDEPAGCGAFCNPDAAESSAAGSVCTDGRDNDCDGDADSLEAACAVGCASADIDEPVAMASIGNSSSGSLGADVLRISTGGTSETRALVRFDLSSLPPLAQVVKAKMKAHRESSSGGPAIVAVHEVTTPWEGDETTWTSASSAVPWSVPGGDVDPQTLDVAAIASSNTSWDVTGAVAAWASGARANDGFLFRADVSAIPFEVRLDGEGPRLSLDYCLP